MNQHQVMTLSLIRWITKWTCSYSVTLSTLRTPVGTQATFEKQKVTGLNFVRLGVGVSRRQAITLVVWLGMEHNYKATGPTSVKVRVWSRLGKRLEFGSNPNQTTC